LVITGVHTDQITEAGAARVPVSSLILSLTDHTHIAAEAVVGVSDSLLEALTAVSDPRGRRGVRHRFGRAHLIDPTARSTANPIMPAPKIDTAKERPGSLTRACRPSGTPALTHAQLHPSKPPGASQDLLRRPHRVPNDAGIKALRPLRGRAPREP
jgi:hypothetical protein